MTIDETLKSRIVNALRAGDRNARNPEDRQEARELVYLLTVEQVAPAPEPVAEPEVISPATRASMRMASQARDVDDDHPDQAASE